MAQTNRRVIRRAKFTFTDTGVTWISTAVGDTLAMGRRGLLRSVKCRMSDASADAAATADLYIVGSLDLTPAALAAVPDDLNISYEDSATVYTASATEADLDDNLMSVGGAAYEVSNIGDLIIALNVTAAAGAGDNVFIVLVEYEVMD